MTISRQQITLLIILTLVWGFNWPMLKLGVSEFPPLSFRSLSMWLGLPFLALVLYLKKIPFQIPGFKRLVFFFPYIGPDLVGQKLASPQLLL